MIGHPLSVLVIWIGLIALLTACCLFGYMLVKARKSAAGQDYVPEAVPALSARFKDRVILIIP